MNFLCKFKAATPVEPLPIQLSSIISPSCVYVLIKYSSKPTGRNYECQCGYKQHRDVVGAMNILNFNEKDVQLEKYNNLKYLRIA